MTELEVSGPGEHPPSYMIFVVVFLFFLTGLLGFLICHLLKKKGYRCRAGDMEDDDEEEEKLGGNADDEDENQDTVEQILKCIIENEANMEAFNEMIGNHNVCVRHDPRLRKESIGGIPPHLHTVHSGTDHNTCHLCAQVKSKKGRRHSRTPRFKQRPGEQTVFSVGRFRVIHTDKKLQGAPNPLVGSGDQLNQSQDSEERKEGGYNLRNMFKDVRPPSENTNGVAPAVGKRRKSLTIFGLRRGSDPVPAKAGEGTERETGGVRFAIQQQPVVMEERSLGENTEVISSKPGIKPKTEPSKNPIPAFPKPEAKTSDPEGAPLTCDLRSAPQDGSQQGRSPELGINLGIKPPAGSTPNSLPVLPPAPSGQIVKTAERPTDLKNKVLEYEDGYDPGPVQTSTPIAPMYGSLIPTNQPQSYPSNDYPVTQTPPDQSSSPDNDQGFGANLALISLGSSPPSSYPIQSQSSASSLKTPTSPLAITPSPKLSTRNTPLEATKTGFSPILTPSPKLPSGRAPSSSFGLSASPLQVRTPSPGFTSGLNLETTPVSPRTPSSPADQKQSSERSPHLTLKSEGVTSKGGTDSSPLPVREEEQEGASIPRREEKTEVKRAGILKKAKLSPVEGYQFYEDRPTNLLLSPSSPLSLSSPTEGRISGVTIVKASPDSKREFSVVTMVENEDSSTPTKEQERETSELGDKSGTSSAVDKEREVFAPGVGEPKRQSGESSGAKVRPTVSQDRDDMMEMEDIRDCKVTQEEEVESREEKASSVSKQD
ncbi:RELT-like protein 2 [Cheilinus undulatus]|uniref:RELT-like protein 2 n=1 Tax=Cheilinus undulatus TaxID=241271 RepID=UPI001BD452C9|nr:RELT-like protein 2 [Cheilinus undulatus]XP_041653116.1 RELT-like protein 2 [Cheilinus undulatus]XP_041653117.1 RELT-like protein 2 [Cheilinus undulatus]